jgi:hypothetical protein
VDEELIIHAAEIEAPALRDIARRILTGASSIGSDMALRDDIT